jgi:NAD(P)-dependent dehydrogenase (short-subunit alcohol dehydrogenase family)
MIINGKVALVTGGASGLGLATARRLHAEGAKVVMVDLPSSAGAQVARELGRSAMFVAADVTSESEVQAAIDAAVGLGQLAAVVNCAGVGNAIRVVGKQGPYPLDAFRKVVEINLIGTFNVIRLAAAAMLDQPLVGEERGVIVNTASVAAYDGQIGQAAYSASKSGVAGMTLPIARELAQHAIRVVTIAPGLFLTPLFETLSAEAIASLGSQVPHPQRLGRPEEYADLAAHVVSNPMLNGETIRLDGAIRMAAR